MELKKRNKVNKVLSSFFYQALPDFPKCEGLTFLIAYSAFIHIL